MAESPKTEAIADAVQMHMGAQLEQVEVLTEERDGALVNIERILESLRQLQFQSVLSTYKDYPLAYNVAGEGEPPKMQPVTVTFGCRLVTLEALRKLGEAIDATQKDQP